MFNKLSDLTLLSKGLPKARLAVAMGNDNDVIAAVEEARKFGAIYPILIGPYDEIYNLIKDQYDVNDYLIIDANTPEDAALKAVQMVNDNKADLLMKGILDTKVLLKAVVNKETGIKEHQLLSHVAVLEFAELDRLIFATDCAMVISPSLEEKVQILNNALELTKVLGLKIPKVGITSAVEKVNPKILSTVEASELVNLYKGRSDVIVEGPFAIDNLVSKRAALHKGINSRVAGAADIFLFPNLEAGNIFYKTSVFLAGAEVCGLVIGAKAPIILTSRADSKPAKLYSILLAMVYNYGKNNLSN